MGARAIGGWLALAGSMTVLAAPAHAAPALHVIPFPGTPDASPLSHVIFSSLHPADLRAVTVTGSSTGLHSGRVISLPDGAGTAFIPDRAFAPGERVSVSAALASASAGKASGDPGALVLKFSFGVAVPAAVGSAAAERRDAGPSSAGPPTQSFRSAPRLHPPVISASSNATTAPGDIFLAPSTIGGSGPMILDAKGRLVWFHPVPGVATNLEVQRYLGAPVLTWWQGRIFEGNGTHGQDVIMNRSYHVVKILHGGYGYSADLHEFQLTPQGTALIDAFVPVHANLSSVGGPSGGVLTDCVIQVLDVRTGQVLWEWHAMGHVPLGDSYVPVDSNESHYGYFHLNSIQQLPGGNLLISARNTWAVYEISRTTGKIVWTLGGKDSSFRVQRAARFEFQHDAHMNPGGVLTVFDDAADPQKEPESSAKVIHLNTTTMTASLVRRYDHSPPLLAGAVGSAQLLGDRDMFVGWGTTGEFSEYTPSGRQIFNGSFPGGVYSYRVYRFPWDGQPKTLPSLAVSPQRNGSVRVYASWNGATQVAAWRVLAGTRPGALRPVEQSRKTGFETVLTLNGRPRYVAVQALGAGDDALATSRTDAVGH